MTRLTKNEKILLSAGIVLLCIGVICAYYTSKPLEKEIGECYDGQNNLIIGSECEITIYPISYQILMITGIFSFVFGTLLTGGITLVYLTK